MTGRVHYERATLRGGPHDGLVIDDAPVHGNYVQLWVPQPLGPVVADPPVRAPLATYKRGVAEEWPHHEVWHHLPEGLPK